MFSIAETFFFLKKKKKNPNSSGKTVSFGLKVTHHGTSYFVQTIFPITLFPLSTSLPAFLEQVEINLFGKDKTKIQNLVLIIFMLIICR